MLQLFYYRVYLKWFLSIIFLFTRMFRREIRNLKWEASKGKVKKLLQLKLGIESQSASALGVWNRFLQFRCFFQRTVYGQNLNLKFPKPMGEPDVGRFFFRYKLKINIVNWNCLYKNSGLLFTDLFISYIMFSKKKKILFCSCLEIMRAENKRRNGKRKLFVRIFVVNVISWKYHLIYARNVNGNFSKFWKMAFECLLYSHNSSVLFA